MFTNHRTNGLPRRSISCLLLALILMSQTAQAEFSLNRTRLVHHLDSPTPKLKITNLGDDTRSFSVTASAWEPAVSDNQLLVVSPNTFELAPGQDQPLSFYLVGEPQAPQYHRIYIREGSTSDDDLDAVFVVPFYTVDRNAQPAISAAFSDGTLLLENSGDQAFFLESVSLPNGERIKRQFTVFPGKAKQISVPHKPTTLQDAEGNRLTLR